MRTSSSIDARGIWRALGCALVMTGCAASGAASVPTLRPSASEPEVVNVEGQVVQVGARQVAYIEAFPSPRAPVLGAPVRLHLANVSDAHITAVVTHVEPRLDGWLEVEADLVRRADHLATATPFTGQIILRPR